jgi:hypothetical protein
MDVSRGWMPAEFLIEASTRYLEPTGRTNCCGDRRKGRMSRHSTSASALAPAAQRNTQRARKPWLWPCCWGRTTGRPPSFRLGLLLLRDQFQPVCARRAGATPFVALCLLCVCLFYSVPLIKNYFSVYCCGTEHSTATGTLSWPKCRKK